MTQRRVVGSPASPHFAAISSSPRAEVRQNVTASAPQARNVAAPIHEARVIDTQPASALASEEPRRLTAMALALPTSTASRSNAMNQRSRVPSLRWRRMASAGT
jgi:hypothetical protein